MAFGSNELFKEVITYFDRKIEGEKTGVMPLSQIFLSGMFTGMVSSLAIVYLLII